MGNEAEDALGTSVCPSVAKKLGSDAAIQGMQTRDRTSGQRTRSRALALE